MTTSALLYKDMGVSVTSFAFWTSIVCLPWSFKPLWAPFVERFKSKRWWVVSMQALLVVLFVALGLSLLLGGYFYLVKQLKILIVDFVSANYDIA